MPLSAAQYRALIPTEIGDTGVVSRVIDILWAKHDHHGSLELRYLCTKLDAIDMLVAHTDKKEEGALERLKTMRERTVEEIARYRVGGIVATGQMEAQAPVESPTGYPDANSGYYRGDPNNRWGP